MEIDATNDSLGLGLRLLVLLSFATIIGSTAIRRVSPSRAPLDFASSTGVLAIMIPRLYVTQGN